MTEITMDMMVHGVETIDRLMNTPEGEVITLARMVAMITDEDFCMECRIEESYDILLHPHLASINKNLATFFEVVPLDFSQMKLNREYSIGSVRCSFVNGVLELKLAFATIDYDKIQSDPATMAMYENASEQMLPYWTELETKINRQIDRYLADSENTQQNQI